jgi:alkylated DNA repair dioxygenase AlkB
MNTLFSLESLLPDGFSYYPNFITEAEEKDLMKAVSKASLHAFRFQGFEAKRKVASFGYDWSFDKQRLVKGKEIPPEFEGLIAKVAGHMGIPPTKISELLVTEYPVGSVINWHRDAPPFDWVMGISLMADCIFRLRPYDKAKQSRRSLVSFPVGRRSLYLMQGEARTDWQHSTAPVAAVRYSITLRTLKEHPAKNLL